MNNPIAYPQFRKYKNNVSYFKINTPNEFEELKFENGKWVLYSFKAKILPDRNFIYDMTFDYHNFWDNISETEYNELKDSI